MSTENIDFERVLRTQLRQRAAAATPPPDAYARFVTARSTGAGRPTPDASDGEEWIEPTALELRPSEHRENRSRTWLLLGAVAACVVVLLVAIGSAGDEDDEPSAADSERVDNALSVMDDYFARFEDGDLDGIMALFTVDAEFSDGLNVRTRDQFEAVTAWDIAQGSTNVSPRCTADDPIDVTVTVRCVFGNHQHIARVVGAPPVEVTLTATITPDGITNLGTDYDGRGYTAVNAPFSRWIIETHPEALVATNCCGGTTPEHSQLNGEMRARYADEWAAYLRANGCRYESDCSTATTAVD